MIYKSLKFANKKVERLEKENEELKAQLNDANESNVWLSGQASFWREQARITLGWSRLYLNMLGSEIKGGMNNERMG